MFSDDDMDAKSMDAVNDYFEKEGYLDSETAQPTEGAEVQAHTDGNSTDPTSQCLRDDQMFEGAINASIRDERDRYKKANSEQAAPQAPPAPPFEPGAKVEPPF